MFLLFRTLNLLPLWALHTLGSFLGWITWLASPTYRRRMDAYLAQAGLSQYRNEAIAAAGKMVFELPKIWLRPQAELVARIAKLSGWEHVEAAWASGSSILYLTPHLGCFEITAQYIAAHRPITVLYRAPRKAWLQPLYEAGRTANLKIAAADMSGVRALLKALRSGEAVGMLPDQVPGNGEGVWAPFFGRPAYSMTLAARMADTGATVLLTYAERLPHGGGYHLRFMPLSAPLIGSTEEKVTQLNSEIERLVRQCPGQYLWSYNRYKRPKGAPPPPEEVQS
ncbi:MAG TPA: lysophospholipid acyltransferase family protein [Rhodocyclaceae bacterium]|jgi:KDO2-lipid IV(A) lauroyltransferase|nr:lysophospholipid acyltransferase family protein [Rhodocyclaceae bacterium]